MRYRRLPIEIESPEQLGYDRIRNNLAESSVRDLRLDAIDPGLGERLAGLVLAYGDHLGRPDLRSSIATHWSMAPEEILTTPGAVAALFLVHSALLAPSDHVVVAAPNYATNLETPRAIGADVTVLEARREDDWRIAPERIAAAMTARTVLVSLTSPGNPTGTVIARPDLDRVLALVEAHPRARLLLDETYRDLADGVPSEPVAARSSRAISVSSLSKAYGVPGIRLGWLASRDAELLETLLAAKEQIVIANSVVDEAIGAAVLEARGMWLPRLRAEVAAHRSIVDAWIAASSFEWVRPTGGAVGFPRIRPDRADGVDLDRFHRILFEEHGTIVGPGHWFGQPDDAFRLGFGWPTTERLRAGLEALEAALAAAAGPTP